MFTMGYPGSVKYSFPRIIVLGAQTKITILYIQLFLFVIYYTGGRLFWFVLKEKMTPPGLSPECLANTSPCRLPDRHHKYQNAQFPLERLGLLFGLYSAPNLEFAGVCRADQLYDPYYKRRNKKKFKTYICVVFFSSSFASVLITDQLGPNQMTGTETSCDNVWQVIGKTRRVRPR